MGQLLINVSTDDPEIVNEILRQLSLHATQLRQLGMSPEVCIALVATGARRGSVAEELSDVAANEVRRASGTSAVASVARALAEGLAKGAGDSLARAAASGVSGV